MSWVDETEGFVKKRGTVEYEIASRFLKDAGAVNEQLGDEYRLMVGDPQALCAYLDAIVDWHRDEVMKRRADEVSKMRG